MSNSRNKTRRQQTDTADILRLLAALAVRGRFIRQTDNPSTSTVAVSNKLGEMAATCPLSTLEEARRRGWVGPVGAGGHLGLTAAGRETLRRSHSTLAAIRADASRQGTRDTSASAAATNLKESPLTWLASRRDSKGRPMLTAPQTAAGERLRADLYFAQLTPRVTMGWSGLPPPESRSAGTAGHGRELADTVVAARTRVAAALKAVGPEFADILIDVCGHLRGLEEIARAEGWPRRAVRLILQRALAALARHYGLEPEVSAERMIARRLRHWGTEDYRPTLARWSDATGDPQDE